MMSDIDTPVEAPKKVIKKKPRKKRAFPRARIEEKTAPKVPAEFAGLNPRECCNACNKDGCVISGVNYCAHPFKGGLQTAQMNDHEALKRFNRAKAALKDQQVDLTLR